MEQEQLNALATLIGTTGTHYDLAKRLEREGFNVVADPDNAERSIVKLVGVWNPDGSDCDVAQIVGDSEAVIVAG